MSAVLDEPVGRVLTSYLISLTWENAHISYVAFNAKTNFRRESGQTQLLKIIIHQIDDSRTDRVNRVNPEAQRRRSFAYVEESCRPSPDAI